MNGSSTFRETRNQCQKCARMYLPNGGDTCDECLEKAAIDRWKKAGRAAWVEDGRPIYSELQDEYYHEWCYVTEYAHDNRLTLEDMRLYCCVPCLPRYVDYEYLLETCGVEANLSMAVHKAIDELNILLRKEKHLGYEPTIIAVDIPEDVTVESWEHMDE